MAFVIPTLTPKMWLKYMINIYYLKVHKLLESILTPRSSPNHYYKFRVYYINKLTLTVTHNVIENVMWLLRAKGQDMKQSYGPAKHGCYFQDGERRADYVIVVDAKKPLAPLSTYIRTLEGKGLQLEKARGQSVPKIFLLVHISKKALQYYSRLYDIGLDEKKVIFDEEEYSQCLRAFSTPICHIPGKVPGEFTSAERILIINKILESAKFAEGDEDYGLGKLIRLKMVEDAYPLHDGPETIEGNFDIDYANDRQLLYYYWSNPNMWHKEIPLNMIEKYFGCEIAFYFAWLQFFNQMLLPVAIFAIVVIITNVHVVIFGHLHQVDEVCSQDNMYICPTCQVYDECYFKPLSSYCVFTKWTYIFDNYLTVAYAVLMSFWATLFVNLWRRKENELKLKWSVQYKEVVREPRPIYMEKAKKKRYNESTGKIEPVVPKYITLARLALVAVLCVLMVFIMHGSGVLVMLCKSRLYTMLLLSGIHFLRTNVDILTMSFASLMQVMFIRIFARLYNVLSIWLTDIENPRTQYDYDSSVLHKRYILAFANCYLPMFYLAFIKGKLYTVPHHHEGASHFEQDTCQPMTCILAVCIQLAFYMIFKKFLGNLLNFLIIKCYRRRKGIKDQEGGTEIRLPQYEEEYKLMPTNRYLLTTEFCEMVIDYGFVTFFVAAYPLVTVFALLNNIMESRTDAYKLVVRYRRPIPRKVPGIGAWDGILSGLTLLSIATNAVVLAFTGDFVKREVYLMRHSRHMSGYVNATLSQFSIADYELYKNIDIDIDVCYYRGMRKPPTEPDKYTLTSRYWTAVTWKLVGVILFEHIIVACNALLGFAIPSVSSSVKQQLDMNRILAREARLKLVSPDLKRFR